MKLTKFQDKWLTSLEDHPKRQCKNVLGKKLDKGYVACCLGEALIVMCRMEHKKIPFDSLGVLRGSTSNMGSLSDKEYKKLGLLSAEGRIHSLFYNLFNNNRGLASANDSGMTWPKIAKLIRKYPQAVFTNES